MNNVVVRRMSLQDVSVVAKIEKTCFSQPWSENGLAVELERDSSYFVVADISEKVVGYAGMQCVCSEGYITNVAVFPEYRKMGIGRKLIHELISYAEANRFEFVTLEVRASNDNAIKLYLSEGFRNVGIRKNFYSKPTEDAIIMTKYINK